MSMFQVAARLPKHRAMSTVAAATVTSDVQDYVLKAATPTVTQLSNGVTVASLYGEGSVGSYATTRISGIGSRYDKVGGESSILASSLGGEVGREHITIPSLSSLTAPTDLESIKSTQITKVEGASYEAQMMDSLHETAFQGGPTGNSLGNFLNGTKDSIAAVTTHDVASVLGGINGTNVCVVGTGSGSHDELVEEAEKAYGSLASAGTGKDVGEVVTKSHFIGSDVRIRYDSRNTATIAIGFNGDSITDPNAVPLALMQNILGSFNTQSGLGQNVASSLGQEMAQHGLAKSISAFNHCYSDAGLFGFVVTSPDNKLDDMMWYAMPNLVRLAHGVSDEEFARAKAALKIEILSAVDGDAVSGAEIAKQLQTIGRVMTLNESLARVDAVTMDDIKTAGSKVISDQDHALAAIGGIHELPDYNWIRRHSYMLRY